MVSFLYELDISGFKSRVTNNTCIFNPPRGSFSKIPSSHLYVNWLFQTFANKLYGPAAFLMPVFVALSCAGGMNGNLLTTSRMFFVSAREGHLPQITAGISTQYLTPLPAVLIMVRIVVREDDRWPPTIFSSLWAIPSLLCGPSTCNYRKLVMKYLRDEWLYINLWLA